jgi:hypothetical protein
MSVTRTIPDGAACRCRAAGSRGLVRRPVIVAPPPVVVEEYPIYAAPRVYAPSVYAYAGPVWRDGWGHRRHFRGRW